MVDALDCQGSRLAYINTVLDSLTYQLGNVKISITDWNRVKKQLAILQHTSPQYERR